MGKHVGVREIRPGVYEVYAMCGYTQTGKRRRVSRTVHGTEAQAVEARMKLLADMGKYPTLGDPMTLDEYYWSYFSPDRHATTTEANAKTHDSIYRVHISPLLGSMDIGAITYLDIKRWIAQLPPQSAPNYVRTLRSVLAQAAYDGIIPESPMEGRRFRMPQGRDTTPRPVWGATEVMDALSRPAFRQSQLFALWCLMCGGGLSRSEALAIDWESIRWESALGMDSQEHWTAYVSIDSAVTTEDGMKGPKNSRRYRSVPIPSVFADPLHERRSTGPVCQSMRHTNAGPVPTGRRLTPDRIPERWKSYFAEDGCLHGLPFVWINRMRATYATLMQGAGIDSTLINALQGRSQNSEVLYANYLNPYQQSFLDASQLLNHRLGAG